MASGGEVNVVFFMEEVQKYDCLYNKYRKSYKDKYIKINCWTKIGEKFDMSVADAEKKFKNVRTGYGGYLKKVKAIPSGSGRDAVPTPKDFAGLDWLQKYISHRPKLNPVEVDSDEDNNSVGEQGETNDQTDQAGSETLELEDSGGSVETSKETGVDEKRTESAEVVEKKRRKVSVTSRPWSSANRKKEAKQRDDVEAALLVTTNSLVEQAKKLPESPKAEPKCEYSYFARVCCRD